MYALYYLLIAFLPVISVIAVYPLWRASLSDLVCKIISGVICITMLISWVLLTTRVMGDGVDSSITLLPFFESDFIIANWSLRADALTDVMLAVVHTISAMVHIFSLSYMAKDSGKVRFFVCLSMFTAAMTFLVTSNNFLQLFFGWEAVGVTSFMLIGFWMHKPSANKASLKAFLVNRVGDAGFLIGIFCILLVFRTLDFDQLFVLLEDYSEDRIHVFGVDFLAVEFICLFLFIGAMGKSAQFLLHTWLPDAMEGPTPVSALIHAATMVTAGVFMLARLSPLYEYAPMALFIVTIVGSLTAFFAATIAMVQTDIKRIIAYSTCSQLGYMVLAAGIGAYDIAVFHLFTHATFKALLFLCAGLIIYSLHHEQDIRKMGGLKDSYPSVFVMCIIGALALTGFGIPWVGGFAGFYSKDAIIEAAYLSHNSGHKFAFVVSLLVSAFTAFYTWRMLIMVFLNRREGAHEENSKPQVVSRHPNEMIYPIVILSILSVVSGWVMKDLFIGEGASTFWNESVVTHIEASDTSDHLAHHPWWLVMAPFISMASGTIMAFIFYASKSRLPERFVGANPVLYRLLTAKWFFDIVYDAVFVRGALWLGRLLYVKSDQKIIDVFVNSLGTTFVPWVGRLVRGIHSGRINDYVIIMMTALIFLITFVLL